MKENIRPLHKYAPATAVCNSFEAVVHT